MLLVWFFMGLLDVLITEVWRKTAWLRLSMSTVVHPQNTLRSSPPPTRKKISSTLGGGFPISKLLGACAGGRWRRSGGERSPLFHRGPSISVVRVKTQP